MTQQTPPPPPLSRRGSVQHGVHGPGTNFFPGIRAQLISLEQPGLIKSVLRPGSGLIIALLVSAVPSFLVAYAVEYALLPAVGFLSMVVFFAPLIEEPAKALAMLVVAFLIRRGIPSCRYGAVLGVAAGLGFGITESILYLANMSSAGWPADTLVIRVLATPLMHPFWSAFVGIGVFALVAKRPASASRRSSPVLPSLFLFIGVANHIAWNCVAAIPHFFESPTEQSKSLRIAPPPLPPPTVRTCPGCGQPLTFISQCERWYCTKENKYV